MGKIDLHDGAMARTIRLRELRGDIDIDIRDGEAPRITVPEEFEVEQK